MLKHEIAHACGWPGDHPDSYIDTKCEARMPLKQYNHCKPVEIKRLMPYEMAAICGFPACTLCYERGCVIYLPERDRNTILTRASKWKSSLP